MGSRACREIGMEIAALAGGARAGGSAARVQGEVAHQRTRPLLHREAEGWLRWPDLVARDGEVRVGGGLLLMTDWLWAVDSDCGCDVRFGW
jgi:hypothetical protein